jgi:hypothetical protein
MSWFRSLQPCGDGRPAAALATVARRWSRVVGVCAALTCLLITPHVWAGNIACAALAKDASGNAVPVVYGTGGSAHKTLFKKLGAALRKSANPVVLVYQSPGACFALTSWTDAGGLITGTANYWEADGTEKTCDLELTGTPIQFGAAGNAPTSCAGLTGLPAGLGEFTGPVNTWNLFVSTKSSQQSISAEALYFIFGFGKAGLVTPWIDETQLIIRNATSAAQIFIAKAAGIPPEKFIGVDAKSNAASISLVADSKSPEAAIGFASGENVDAKRDVVRTLAYQAKDQLTAYWPDSTVTSFDKRPTREGLYWIWSPIHISTPVDTAGKPKDPWVAKLVGWFDGSLAEPADVPVSKLVIGASNIPKCAMTVWRDGDLGALYSYAPPAPCGCYFESIANGKTDCATCKADAECTNGGKCRQGFCEAY